MMKPIFFVIIFLFMSENMNAQTGPVPHLKKEKKLNAWKDQMELDRQKIRELLGVDMLGDVSKRFEELIKKFHGSDMNSFFQDDNFSQFLDDWDPYEGLAQGSSHWMETPKERILIMKYKSQKDSPIDIKIEKGKIQIKGTSEEVSEMGGVKSKSVSTFHQTYSIPSDVDAEKAIFENKNGEILIKFPKINPGKGSDKNRPVTRQQGDITI